MSNLSDRTFRIFLTVVALSVLSLALWPWATLITLFTVSGTVSLVAGAELRTSTKAAAATSPLGWQVSHQTKQTIKLLFGLGVVLLTSAVLVWQREAIGNVIYVARWAFDAVPED